jgi:hypothetical protein
MRLADARFTGNERDLSVAAVGSLPKRNELLKLATAANQLDNFL